MTHNPYDLEVTSCTHDTTCGCYDPNHAAIWITNQHTYNPDLLQMLDSLRWTAGILGRLALTLSDQIAEEQTHHNCYRDLPHTEGCAIDCDGTPIWTKYADVTPDTETAQLTLQITVPLDRHNHYLRQISKTLGQLIKSDTWEPSHVDRRAWALLDRPNTPEPSTAADRREQYR